MKICENGVIRDMTTEEITGEAAGGTVVLQYLPHELVGHYFSEVT